MRKLVVVMAVAVLLIAASAGLFHWWAQPVTASAASRLAPGTLLVSQRDMLDPNFWHTVIVLTQYDAESAVGVVINRPSRLRISELLPEAGDRQDRVYLGGPVQVTGILALVRAAKQPDGATPLFDDVYLVNDAEGLKAVAGSIPAERFRLYAGYAGWGAGQLDREISLGAWHIINGEDAKWIFDSEPRTVWDRLARRTEGVMVWLGLGGTPPAG